jgi:hypothetical protein
VPVRVLPRCCVFSGLLLLTVLSGATTAVAQPRPSGPPPGAKRISAKIPDSIAARLPKTPKMPTGDQEIFTQRDARARNVLGYFDCLTRTVKASRDGLLGTVPAAAMLVCVQENSEWRGVVAEPVNRMPGVAVRAQYAMRGKGVLVRDAVDTFTVLATARGQRRAVQAKAVSSGPASLSPVVLPYDSYLEVLYVPVPGATNTTLFVGGDSIIQMAPDGSRELGHSRAAPPITPLTVNTGKSGEALIQSTQPQVPLVSELVAARSLLPRYRVVKLQSGDYTFTLTRTAAPTVGPADGTWTSAAR